MGLKRDGHVHSKTCGDAHFQKAGDRPRIADGQSSTGTMLAGCHHMLLLGSLNMFEGERYAYVYMLAAQAIEQYGVKWLYGDLMCKWGPYFQKLILHTAELPDVPVFMPTVLSKQMEGVELLVSGVHVNTHVWWCKVSRTPRADCLMGLA